MKKMNLYIEIMIPKTNKRKFMELLRECRKQLWLYETKQIVQNEREIQLLNIIHENILNYLEEFSYPRTK